MSRGYVILVIASFAMLAACEEQQPAVGGAMNIETAQQRLTDSLITMPGVSGVALGECDGEPCIKVLVVNRSEELLAKIPNTFEGFAVQVEETGEIEALGNSIP